jgi:non-specific serine/threonine protein kinase
VLGVARNTLARWERGELEIRHAELVELALGRIRNGVVETPTETKTENGLHNLPAELTSIVGREQEERDLTALLGATRLMTFTGPGGVGKTRLALRIAWAVLPNYANGVWFVDLSTVSSAELVAEVVKTTLRVRDLPGQSVTASLIAAVARRQTLLVLDNCEHLIEPCARLVSNLLQSSTQLRVLATSREPLGVAGETVRRLAPLAIPDLHQSESAEQLTKYSAVQLLLERAAAHGAEINPAKTGPALAAICARLDGLPLALELAAARLPVLAPVEVANRLDDTFRMLVGVRHDAPERHSTLWATIDWSYMLLPATERMLFAALSIFAGGWTLEACESVARDATEPTDVVDLLSRLVSKSLVVAETQPGGPTRYRLLDTVRQYARTQLGRDGRSAELRARHCAWFLEQAERANQAAHTPAEAREFRRLDADLDNLRAALEWLVARSGSEHEFVVAGRLWWFWQTIGHYREGREYLERLLARFGEEVSPGVRAEMLHGAGALAWNQRGSADLEASRAYFEDALAIRRQIEDDRGVYDSLGGLARPVRDQGDDTTAARLMEELLPMARAAGDRWVMARTLNGLGLIAMRRGQSTKAMEYFEQSLNLSKELNDPAGVATELGNMAVLAYEQGDVRKAVSLATESLVMRRDLGVRWSVFAIFDVMTGLAARRGKLERAARLFGASDRLREESGQTLERRPPFGHGHYLRDVASARSRLGAVAFAAARATGRSMPFEQALAEALEDYQSTGTVASAPNSKQMLTPRERQVADLLASGLTNRQIAVELVVSEATAAKHVENIREKLGVTSRTQIVAWITAAQTA